MNDFNSYFRDSERITQYREQGPPSFTPGHAGLLQMSSVLLAEHMPPDGDLLVVGAGGGLETEYLATIHAGWRFLGVDPAGPMLDLARATAGKVAGDRLTLIKGTVAQAPQGPFNAATCILVLGLVPDDGSKLELLSQTRQRLKPGAPLILVDQCMDRAAADFDTRLDRYASYARLSGVAPETVTMARNALSAHEGMVSADRNEELLKEAGFRNSEVFYVGMAWRGWASYA